MGIVQMHKDYKKMIKNHEANRKKRILAEMLATLDKKDSQETHD